jgi:hypothetical protein
MYAFYGQIQFIGGKFRDFADFRLHPAFAWHSYFLIIKLLVFHKFLSLWWIPVSLPRWRRRVFFISGSR